MPAVPGRRLIAGCLVLLFSATACSSTPAASTVVATASPVPTSAPTESPAAASATPVASAPATASPTPAAVRTAYPITVETCGVKATFDAAPARVVTIDPSMTEMLLSLGLKDRIAGYTEFFAPDQQWAATKADMATLKMINDGANYPSKEAIIAARPDLVASVYPYAFMDPLPDRAGWGKLKVNTYQALGSCPDGGKLPSDFGLLYADLHNLGVIFDVQDKADAEIAALKARVAELSATASGGGRTIAPYDAYENSATFYGGFENAVITAAGGKYVWAGVTTNYPSWEQFVAADPQVIWIIPDAGTPTADLEKKIAADPRLKNVTGVKAKAFVVVPQADSTIESPRLVDGLGEMVAALAALK
ncbi:MAG: ABC transporter substrate-binding protein [Chloroflexota bacterium]